MNELDIFRAALHCGRLPKSYIPGTVDVRSRFTSASSEPSRSRNGSRIRIRGRIVGAQPANIMQYPWQVWRRSVELIGAWHHVGITCFFNIFSAS